MLDWSRAEVRRRFGETGYEIHYTVYGRDGILGEMEPLRDSPAHELCITVQGVASTTEMAEELTLTGLRQVRQAPT